MSEHVYDPSQIEPKWQAIWEESRLHEAKDDEREKYYILEMLPYPSGTLHMGHVRNYSIGDALARYKSMRGFRVLHPMGWDSFGLPAENAAIKNKKDPGEWTRGNIAEMRKQLQRFGFSYDWDREMSSCEPEYYRWNQWTFLQMWKRGLAYRKKALLNWCPECQTVLANEQVVDGCCWRHEDAEVEQRELDQWYLRITDYADELLRDLETLGEGWPDRVRTMQTNWIGRSTGAEVDFGVEGSEAKIRVFTTRVDTIYGSTCVLLAPRHPLVDEFGLSEKAAPMVTAQRTKDAADLEKDGFFTGRYAINPYSGEKVPIWVANFVLMEYGTGAIMAVPAHDQRDFEFCRKFGIAIVPVIRPLDGELPVEAEMEEAAAAYGVAEVAGPFSGLGTEEAKAKMAAHAEAEGFGKATVTFRLRDWGISRQRYWGTPIPMIHCATCGVVPVPEEDLPVLLPAGVELTGEGESPLKQVAEFYNVACPECGGEAHREADTMDTFVDSSWYFYRYTDAKCDTGPFRPEKAAAWFPIDQYIGGIEHAVLHLIYCRFWSKVLRDIGLLTWDEPVSRLFTQGMVIREGAKMSKSKGNVVSPTDLVAQYGADTARVFALFAAPPEKDLDWQDDGVEGMHKFLKKVYRLVSEHADAGAEASSEPQNDADRDVLRKLHQVIAHLTSDFDVRWHFNTSLAQIMELVNLIGKHEQALTPGVLRETLGNLVLLMGPFAPYMADELWSQLGGEKPVFVSAWPVANEALMKVDTVELPVQVNGKLRGKIVVSAEAAKTDIEAAAQQEPNVVKNIDGKTVRKIIVVPGRMVNIIAK